ncbi:uncharacterized protein LOC129726538 [Wyeomyia smithii]|uniref:uncharacterized protein LOC129726538 n=1 Tax=Wyeomyia smithii TaxID=174621 RepID=UPI002467CA0D|nr:uncharacterized protein LOC129726538 [Wyeomyia smithii]XP_055539336.1 uncharacterized protein LOC129726538 [Wyeomyia smithii]XP_055539337.1 uncharacterized protein LOC129726538 [Wyeomyia smithii]XP_055539339.1 uncharacterized protein LOC129726538 [Wyeomyia smithii]XP_055539340.1 uncharacterized protein LOC129726538 [Wyeomyia smithii]XP_055539341.1 uncharacterized protein LOC129726538 [Wyeomyia smithii]XP_055539342.1 uncharacterized protein LOC129726538 [Wyeomyia smithii]XP_055539343.1 unc
MILSNMLDLRPALLLTLFATIEFVSTLKDVRVSVPAAIRRGDNANLICHYDMEGAALYSVKWYKGKREFFRYTPKENPSLKAFPVLGITVERSQSNGSYVTLSTVEPTMSGKYSCEVSADSPSFHTMIVSSEMEVVDVPISKPHITGLKSFYRIGDLLTGNCSSHNSKPAANLTWFINSNEVNPKQTVPYAIWKNPETGLETSTLGLFFHITQHYLGRGKLKFTCVARIHSVYEQRTERFVEDEQPNILASASASPPLGMSINYIHSLYDQFPASSYHHHDHGGSGGDFDNQNSDAYMTQLQDMSSSSASSSRTRSPMTISSRRQPLRPLLLLIPAHSVIMQMAFSILLPLLRSMFDCVNRRAARRKPSSSNSISRSCGGLQQGLISILPKSFS